MNQLILAMIQALQGRQQGAPVAQQRGPGTLARAMMGGKRDPKWNSLEALKPYGESDFADRFGARPAADPGAFQGDGAFEDGAFQTTDQGMF